MTTPTSEVHPSYSEPGAEATPWPDVDGVLSTAQLFWISTVRADGRPHVTPIPAVWDAGALHICTGRGEQKQVNIVRDPRVVLTTGTPEQNSGLDVVLEGTATPVTDRPRLVELAALWKARLDWDYEVKETSFDDGAGHDGLVYAVVPGKVLAFSKDPHAQTRFTF